MQLQVFESDLQQINIYDLQAGSFKLFTHPF